MDNRMTKVDDKRQAILEATLRLVAEHGFHGTAMSKIAKEAKVSAGIIYHYFDNKDELLVELYKWIKIRTCATHCAAVDESQPLRAQIYQMWGSFIRNSLENPLETNFMSQFATSPYYTAEVEAQVAPYFTPMMERFERAKKEMIIKDMPPAFFATLVLDVPNSLALKQSTGQLELTEELINDVIESLWQAIRL